MAEVPWVSLLQKGNSNATVRSTAIWTIGGAVGFSGLGIVVCLAAGLSPFANVFILAWIAIWGALAGFAMEWQLDDGSDDDDA